MIFVYFGWIFAVLYIVNSHTQSSLIRDSCFIKSAEEGNVTAQFMLARHWYGKAASQGHIEALFHLGLLYQAGLGGVIQATELYHCAAQQGCAEAQVRLGRMYNSGHSVSKNTLKAAELFHQAAEQGHAKAQFFWLGGHGIFQDKPEALHWYRKAASQGHAEARVHLGLAISDKFKHG